MAAEIFIDCVLSRGAFSAERLFKLSTYGGSEYVGIAPVYYCYKRDFSRLGMDEPRKSIDGLIEARLVTDVSDRARVSIPDGATIDVPSRILKSKAPTECTSPT